MKTFKKFLSKTQKGFTLVELIIVITILAILGTVAFSSYRGITESARDTSRLATLKELEKGLSIFKEKTGNYPTPEGKIYTGVLSLSGYVDYSYVGIVGENISNQLKLNSIPLDPLSNTNYIYAININKTSYQIATVLEVLQAYKKPEQNMKFDKGELCLTQKTYANSSSYKAKVLGTHKENVKIENGGKTWLTTVPSMIFDPTVLSGNILNSSGSYLIVNKGKNLPYKLSADDTTANQKGNEIMQILKENTNAKIATIDITEIVNKTKTVEQIFGTGGTEEKIPGITSKEILSSFGVKEEDLGNASAITSKMETIITGQTSTITNTTSQNNTTVNATCGSANGATVASIPTSNLCGDGTTPSVSGTGPWSWTCVGTGTPKGDDIVCSANKTITNSCSATLPANATTIAGTPTMQDQPWQTTNSADPCYFSCNENYGYNGTACVSATNCGDNGVTEITIGTGATLQTWSCMNKGATTVRNGSTTCANGTNCSLQSWAGNYYQWGKSDTGRTNGISGLYDWKITQVHDAWGGSLSDTNTSDGSGTTKIGRKGPCPIGWHIPSAKDWQDMCNTVLGTICTSTTSYNSTIATKLRLPFAGNRNRFDGAYQTQSTAAQYWSSSPSTTRAYNLYFGFNTVIFPDGISARAYGFSIRCIKN